MYMKSHVKKYENKDIHMKYNLTKSEILKLIEI